MTSYTVEVPDGRERGIRIECDELGEWLDNQPHLSPSGLLQKAIREQQEKEAE
jgi:hypothetical protein